MDPQQMQVPPEVLQAMLELSTQNEDDIALKQQMELSKMLQGGALKYNGNAGGGNAIGGFASALAQGMQGYSGGQQHVANKSAIDQLKRQRQGNRAAYFNYATKPPQANGMPGPLDDENLANVN